MTTHMTKVVDLLDNGMRFPLKSEYDRVNFTLEGIRRNIQSSALDLPSPTTRVTLRCASCLPVTGG